MSEGSAASSLARATRAPLLETLDRLQRLHEPPASAERALEHLAQAVSALYAAEAESPSESAADADLRLALVELARALEALHEVPSARHEFEHETASVARALAQLYPELRNVERRQRERLLPGAEPSEDSRAVVALDAMDERLVAPPRSERARALVPVEDVEQRRAVERTIVEVDVGLLSDSNFYTGLSEDVSTGGVFVATHMPLAVGTLVQVFFTLDGGQSVEAAGEVRWSREAGPAVTPGMGIAFSELSREQAAAIVRYAASRPPLFHL